MTSIPIRGAAFETMMRGVDGKLADDGIDIVTRPIMAVGEVSKWFGGIAIPIGDSPFALPRDLRETAPIGTAIKAWYDRTYGERLKVDMSAGSIVVEIDSDLYALKAPRIFGRVDFVVSRTFLPEAGIQRGPVTCNIVQLIDDMTPSKAAGLSGASLNAIDLAFQTLLPAAYTLESTDLPLMYEARGDAATAVAQLMDRSDRYGAARWASLQVAEKVLKASIQLQGGTFKFTHDLRSLSSRLDETGVVVDLTKLIADIQCTPAIRYGDEPCTRRQALAAHHASLELVNTLTGASVGFQSGLG